MSTIKDGGPAFPVEVDSTQPDGRQTGSTLWQSYGMSLRDHYAGKAMQGELSAMSFSENNDTAGLPMDIEDEKLLALAQHWFRIADAMIKAREGGEA